MKVNDELIKAILEKLDEAYPNSIDAEDEDARERILEGHDDREEIREHLDYCKNAGWISFKITEKSADFPHGKLKDIMITPKGLDYLEQ
ncbi:MAG: DUF2513 domain-containing protein [Candidatus Aminicenantes bacterium]|nr:MAG: DUF2513 domain-containing protein [Candidatus Aminicenantes bacterium]